MNIIVAIDQENGIGKNNQLLTHIPNDMKFFKEKTIGNVVIMGRKTLESFPNKKPLKDRINIVISSNKELQIENAIVVNSIENAINEANKYKKEIFIIGGASIYKEFINIVDTLYITKINKAFDADTFFPKINKNEWNISSLGNTEKYNDLTYQFFKYDKK